jgi:hypothetical protein
MSLLRSLFTFAYSIYWSRNKAVGIAIGYGLDGRGVAVRVPIGAIDFSLLDVAHTGCEAHPASCPMVIGGSIPGVKATGA